MGWLVVGFVGVAKFLWCGTGVKGFWINPTLQLRSAPEHSLLLIEGKSRIH
jgi:hypothetical protein